jgi:GNAT superfamily N-acetyltransferase
MRINTSQLFGTNINNFYNKSLVSAKSQKRNNTPVLSFNNASSENYKANFLPSFGKYRKISDVMLREKGTGKYVSAELKRDRYGNDFFSYKIFVKGQEAGYMDLCCESLYPEEDYLVPEPDNILPEIKHLRSLLGDKYEGIGTTLVNAAIDESKSRGKNGSLWLTAETGYASSFSNYRKDENPIPFYYKMGFRSLDPKTDKYIQECLQKSQIGMLPKSEVLILTSEAVKNRNKELASNFTVSP